MDYKLILLPIGLVCWFVHFPFSPIVARVLLILSVSGGLARLPLLRRVEARWIILLGLYLAASAVSSLLSVNVSASLNDFGRQVYISVFSILLILSLRHPNARNALATFMLIPTLLAMVLILYLYWTLGTGISNDALHDFKASVSTSLPNIPMNPLAGFVVLTLFAAIPAILRLNNLIWVATLLFVPILVLTGARSTIIAVPLAGVLFLIIRLFSRLPILPRVLALALAATLLVAFAATSRGPILTADAIDELTSHRVHLWQAAITRFSANRWAGAGADTWRTDLTSMLPAEARNEKGIMELSAGAYHSAYLSFLAERGLIVCIPALLVLVFVLRSAFRIYADRKLLTPGDRGFALLAPSMVLFIMIRQLAECSGLLAYASGAADFAAFVVASLIIAIEGEVGQLASVVSSQRFITLKGAAVANYI